MILCEVQEYSDLTYRVYDYGRTDAKGKPRELHVQKALDVMQFGQTAGGKIPSLPLYSGSYGIGGKRTLLSPAVTLLSSVGNSTRTWVALV